MVAVHFALVTVQEGHGKDVVRYGSGYKLAQHLGDNRENIMSTMPYHTLHSGKLQIGNIWRWNLALNKFS